MYILLLLTITTVYGLASEKEVTTTDGPVIGKVLEEINVISFMGIPYAKPPLGKLRFEDAQKLEKRHGKFEAFERNKPCYRFRNSENFTVKSEDCLYLSIFRPIYEDLKQLNLLAIFTNTEVNTDSLMELVNGSLAIALVNFRQGPLGYFSKGDKLGTAATSDILLAIDWLHQNKDYFGYNDITLIAENDEASSVAHAIGDAVDKFKRAILLNGNSAVRRMSPKYYQEENNDLLLTKMNCSIEREEESINCLKSSNIEILFNETTKYPKSSKMAYVEAHGSLFRPKKSGKENVYPVILGVFKSLNEEYLHDMAFDPKYTSSDYDLFMDEFINENYYKNVHLLKQLAYHHYVKYSEENNDTYHLWTRTRMMIHDRDFSVPTRELANNFDPDHNPVYFFEYDHINPLRNCIQKIEWEAAQKFCSRLWGYFKHFAITGQPTEKWKSGCDLENPEWPAYRSTKRDYYLSVKPNGKVDWEFNYRQAAFAFWHYLVSEMEKIEFGSEKEEKKEDKKRFEPKTMLTAIVQEKATTRLVKTGGDDQPRKVNVPKEVLEALKEQGEKASKKEETKKTKDQEAPEVEIKESKDEKKSKDENLREHEDL